MYIYICVCVCQLLSSLAGTGAIYIEVYIYRALVIVWRRVEALCKTTRGKGLPAVAVRNR